jgi:DNA-binding CsgD family transcriptional regulator
MVTKLTAARTAILEQVAAPPPGAWFAESALKAVSGAVGFDGYCLFGVDPLTGLRSAMFARHGITAATEHLLHNETVEQDANRYLDLAASARHAGVLTAGTSAGRRSPRAQDLLRPDGYTSELRLAMVDGGRYWGSLNLFRADRHRPFTDGDADAMAALGPVLSTAVRRYQVGRRPAPAVARPTGVVLFDREGRHLSTSDEARTWLVSMADSWQDGVVETDVDRVVHEVAAVAAGRRPGLPLCRVRLPDGEWLVVSGSRTDTDPVGVVVVLRRGDVRTVAPAFAAWCGLSPRETEVLGLLAGGTPAKGIARALSLSVLTVNDHLRSVYRKVGVRGRDELLALLC